jgi:hypothetical protein
MNRNYISLCLLVLASFPCSAQTSQSSGGSASTGSPTSQPPTGGTTNGADPKQSFVSPLGLGTGATVAVTQNGTNITAALARQMTNPSINFWQVAFSGTTNTNGQASVYSSQQSDAPAFKGKIGFGHSSFVKPWLVFTRTAATFMEQAWCRDEVNMVNKTLPTAGRISIPSRVSCADAVAMEEKALDANPPKDGTGKIDTKTQSSDQLILVDLGNVANVMTPTVVKSVCDNHQKSDPDFYQICPGQKSYKEYADQVRAYPGLDTFTTEAPSAFQWKVWGSWSPVLTSTPYYAVASGVADLSKKLNWTQLLNTGVGDVALYYKSLAFGLEGGFGQTVQIVQQNVCKNTVSGSVTAQQCNMAMVGKPTPKDSWIAASTLQVAPLPFITKGTGLSTGAQVQFSYTAPTSGGHSSEIALPLYVSPSAKQVSLVVGVQPTWDWNSNPMIGNKFSVSVFLGARPSITKY